MKWISGVFAALLIVSQGWAVHDPVSEVWQSKYGSAVRSWDYGADTHPTSFTWYLEKGDRKVSVCFSLGGKECRQFVVFATSLEDAYYQAYFRLLDYKNLYIGEAGQE